jgi:flavin-dependent dehydrogenase
MRKKEIKNKYDIVIVGAGPAGCSAAKFLSDDYNVLMVDRSKFPRNKSCGGLLVEESQDFIKDWNIPKDIFSAPKYLDLKMIDWDNDLERDLKRGLWNISRERFDDWLLKQTRKSVCFFSGTNFSHFKKEKKEIKVFLETNGKKATIRTKYLVFAGGPFPGAIEGSPVKNRPRYYIAIQYWMKYNRKYKKIKNSACFIYDSQITDFYSWLIPKKGNLIIGSALKEGGDIKSKMKILKEKLKEKFGIFGKVIKKEAAILSRPKNEKDIFLGKDNIFFIGEAAGLISPSTSEGISFALRSGYNCAKAINDDFKSAFSLYKKLSKNLIEEIKKKQKNPIFSPTLKREKRCLFK